MAYLDIHNCAEVIGFILPDDFFHADHVSACSTVELNGQLNYPARPILGFCLALHFRNISYLIRGLLSVSMRFEESENLLNSGTDVPNVNSLPS